MLNNYQYNHKGVYRVGDKNYTNKLEAFLELNRIGGNHNVHWNYHDEIFGRALWSHEPPVGIEELYRQRALQLRENYDHLVLFYSGGADSHTILEAFVKNNIHLDEVFVFGAFKAEQGSLSRLGLDRTPGYYTREYHLIIEPILKELQKTHKFKITVWDWTDKIIETVDNNPDWFWTVGTRFAPDAIPRQYMHEVFRHNDRFEEKGKRTAFIFGVDKPRLFRDDQNVYLAFIDLMLTTGVGNTADINGKDWENDEYFYWTPNMPEIPIKQAHLIYNYLKRTNKLHTLTHINNRGAFHATDYYQMIHPIIYPSWDNRWQIKKPTGPVRDELGGWFFDYAPESTQKRWWEGIKEVERQIGAKWFNQGSVNEGIQGSYSKLYCIGPIGSTGIIAS